MSPNSLDPCEDNFLPCIFDNLSSLVHMLGSVFKDLKDFMLLYAIFLFAFAAMLTLLLDQADNTY